MTAPNRPWAFWLAGILLWFGALPLELYHSSLYYAEGGQSPDAPGMLFAATVYMSLYALPVFLAVLALFLVGYKGRGDAFGWRTRHPFAIILSVVSILLSAFFLLTVLREQFWRVSRLPFTLYLIAWAAYWQLLRAAVVRRHERRDAGVDMLGEAFS